MILDVWCESDIGLKRTLNEDSFLINKELGVFAVADGMGGHRGGEVASAMAVQTVQEIFRNHKNDTRKTSPRVLLSQAYVAASNKIFDRASSETAELQGMGTTLVVVHQSENTIYIGNVGDSRAYLVKGQQIWQLTEDHSLLNEHLRFGLITEQEAPGFAQKNVITRSVGFERDVMCDILERNIQPEDMFIICSDGLSGLVEDKRIAEICSSLPPEKIVAECIKEARKNGGDDNITVMVIYARPQ